MKSMPASFHPFYIDSPSETCGICHKSIDPGRIGHGHTWLWHSFNGNGLVENDKIRDVFHRACIQERLTSGSPNCPNCDCIVANASVYNTNDDFNEVQLSIQENRVYFLSQARKRNLPILKQILETEPVPHQFQCEGLWIALHTNDPEFARILLFSTRGGIQPNHLSLMLIQATIKNLFWIVSILLEYNSAYLLLPEAKKSLGFGEWEIYIAFSHALKERHFAIANLLLKTNFLFTEKILKKTLYLSIKYDYPNGMQYALDNDICRNPQILEKALQLAAQKGDLDMLFKLLQEKSASLIDRGPAICDATSKGFPKAALLLLEGAGKLDLYTRNAAVQNASIHGFTDLLQGLLKNGPITKEARYWSQAEAKNPQCLELLAEAEIV